MALLTSIWSAMDIQTVLVFISVFLFGLLLLRRPRNLPPGPLVLPFIGSILFFHGIQRKRKRLARALNEQREKYGDIIYAEIDGIPNVLIQGYDVINEAFVKQGDVLSDRPSWLKQLKEVTKEGKGVIWQSGHDWRLTRRFTIQTLRDFGVGKTSLEEKIFCEIDAATEYIKATGAKPFNPRQLTSMMITNVIYGIVFGKRFDYNETEFHHIVETLDRMFIREGAGSPNGLLPDWLLKIVNKKAFDQRQLLLQSRRWVQKHIYQQISDHESSFDGQHVRDFVDLYLNAKTEEKSDSGVHTAGNMYRVIMDLFVAGSETTSNTVNWTLLYLQEYPALQTKCRKEIQQVCGDRNVRWTDRGTLPYTEAFLLEVQRMANIAEFSLPHTNEVPVTLGGYTIPAHSLIRANLYSVNMDRKYWSDPQKFNPDRFLKDGKIIGQTAFMPFSTGPRICAGESLAKMEMFMITTNLVQRFTFARGDPSTKHNFEPIFEQITSAPESYMSRATPI
ncbi:cytochrome P450 2J6-like [Mya arenaria]|uniref:cytochrome P450 2J6-like n=1 Tax=Mya arenaria TaxID=6604 RepID=UPI0022E3B24D|nr:cytochrome P450 2J6-like [Mya arenaria]